MRSCLNGLLMLRKSFQLLCFFGLGLLLTFIGLQYTTGTTLFVVANYTLEHVY